MTFFYFLFFVGTYAGLHVYLASPSSIQDSREYAVGEGPDYFPVLVVDHQEDGTETLVLRSLAKADYSKQADAEERSWYLYRVPGEGRLIHADRVFFKVENLPGRRQLVEVSIGETNGQRTSTYAYEIKDNQVSPRSYLLLASFGNNFSPIPFTLIITAILIFLSEKFLVRRLLKPSA
ncbi:MAG: hypothetical protein KKG53_04460 [Proteobacteria bacterium]|nr:hypothetical protein [Pseudomonadota bacterium]